MSKLAGYVIVRGQEPNVEVFTGWRGQPLEPRFAPVDLHLGIHKFAIYKDHTEAEGIRQEGGVEGRIEPLLIGSDTKPNRYEDFKETRNALAVDMDDYASELFDTSSVTIDLGPGGRWVVSLHAEEVLDPPDETDTYRQTEPPLIKP